jgi:uncharacterized LabA/DUF88 family protein
VIPIHLNPAERTALFIDGPNLYSTSRHLSFDVDYRNLLVYFRSRTNIVRAFYYAAQLDTEDYSPLRPLMDWLAYNGFTLVTKAAREFTDATGRRRVHGSMDVELAVDMIEIASQLDHVVLFSGDGDFVRLIERVQQLGIRATVISSARTKPVMVADELRRQADQFVELADIAPEFTRQPTGRRSAMPTTESPR